MRDGGCCDEGRGSVECVSVAAVMCMRDARDARSREMVASAAVRVAAPLGARLCAHSSVGVGLSPQSHTASDAHRLRSGSLAFVCSSVEVLAEVSRRCVVCFIIFLDEKIVAPKRASAEIEKRGLESCPEVHSS